MNRELEGREPPQSGSVISRVKAYFHSNLALFSVATLVGIIAFFAISTDSRYASLGTALANGIGACFTFGGIAFGIGIVIRNGGFRVGRRQGAAKIDGSASLEQQPTHPKATTKVSAISVPQPSGSTGQKFANQLSGNSDLLNFLHPWVRSAAEQYWSHGFYRDAIEHVARSVSATTQEKIWSYKDGTDLMNYAFGTEPPKAGEGRRLRFRGDPKTDTWKNRMSAGQALGRACYQGIRNLAAHEKNLDWSRELTLQYLFLFSVLAQWIEECDVTGAIT